MKENNQNYIAFEIKKELNVVEKLEKLAKEGIINKKFPLSKEELSKMRVYKSGVFNISIFDNSYIEFSRYNYKGTKPIEDEISKIEKRIGYKFR